MGKRPNIDQLDYLFEKGTDFHLSGVLYEEKTGVPLPKDKGYIKGRSALASKAEKYGYLIVDVEEKPIIERTVIFQKVR